MHKSIKYKFLAGIAALVLIIALLAVSCGPAQPAGPITMRYSTGMPPLHTLCTEGFPWYAAEIERRTNGAVKIEVYVGAELYKHDELVDAVTSGAVDMGANSPTHWGGRNPTFGWPGYFFTVTSADHYRKARAKVDKVMERLFEEQGAKMMDFIHYGSTGILSVGAINTVADFKGNKLRGPAPGHVASIETLGGTPAKMSPGEVYDAIAKGAIQGAYSGYSTFNSRKWYEVGKYVVGPVMWDPWFPTMNLALWNSLPGNIQKVFNEVNAEFTEWSIARQESFDEESKAVLRQQGVTIKDLTPQEAAQWTAAMQSGYEKWVDECEAAGYGDEARDILKALAEAM